MKKNDLRFEDFDALKPKLELFTDPMTVIDISVQPYDFQISFVSILFSLIKSKFVFQGVLETMFEKKNCPIV